jgi:Skp family chaperone for outer membrane proteins
MNTLLKSVLLGSIAVATLPSLALAQRAPTAPAGPAIPGIAVANIEAVVGNSNAYKTAATQRQMTYKAQFDAAEARRKQLAAQMQPLADKFTKDRQANAPAASLQQQAQQLQALQDSGSQELQRMLAPVALSEAYVNEQINDKLSAAIEAAMQKKKVTLVLNPQSVIAASGSYNLNQDILAELNTQLPSVQIVPPAGWEPREVREARAAQGAATAPAAPARPAGPQPSGR